MAKRETFSAPGLRIETWRDGDNGRVYCCWKPHTSVFCSDRKAVLRFASWPIKTPTGDALRVWLTEMEGKDAERKSAMDDLRVASAEVSGESVNLQASWDPLAHDVDNDNTRMVT